MPEKIPKKPIKEGYQPKDDVVPCGYQPKEDRPVSTDQGDVGVLPSRSDTAPSGEDSTSQPPPPQEEQ